MLSMVDDMTSDPMQRKVQIIMPKRRALGREEPLASTARPVLRAPPPSPTYERLHARCYHQFFL
jgi:hypothetical protein